MDLVRSYWNTMFKTDLFNDQDKKENSKNKFIKSCPNDRFHRKLTIKKAKPLKGSMVLPRREKGIKAGILCFQDKLYQLLNFQKFQH